MKEKEKVKSLSRVWLSKNRFELSCSVCLTLCNPTDCNLPGSSVHGIFQARILEWVAISFSRGSAQPRDRTCVSCVSYNGRWTLYQCTTWKDPIRTDLGFFKSRLLRPVNLKPKYPMDAWPSPQKQKMWPTSTAQFPRWRVPILHHWL